MVEPTLSIERETGSDTVRDIVGYGVSLRIEQIDRNVIMGWIDVGEKRYYLSIVSLTAMLIHAGEET